tara:strand:+ start:17892 stop:19544 length:1653 start_codon:yes stop_codon:yes gene_type:complete
MQLFGFEISRTSAEERELATLQAIVPDNQDEPTTEIAAGGHYGTHLDLEATAKTEADLVTKYREMVMQPECDQAVEDIVNDAIIMDDNAYPIEIVLDESNLSSRIKKVVREEFDDILRMLDFGNKGYEIFRRWYVDGRLYYQIVIDKESPREGIKQLRYIDPRKIRKMREQKKKTDPSSGADEYPVARDFYLYNPKGNLSTNQGMKIAPDSICHVPSGLVDSRNKMNLGYLHKAIKPLNQLRMLEDAVVIYRLSRAPERRIFYIDVGNLPKMKAEQYLRDMMVKHKNKLVYDASTGEVRDDRRHMTMLEDFWLPRREGGRGTEITTLPGGQNLGEMDDVLYFQKKLSKALNVPVSRQEAEVNFNIGRSTEISRDEIKFQKFINRARNKFAIMFDQLIEIHLALKGIMTRAEWKEAQNSITYNFANDNHFEELKQSEIMTERLRLLGEIDPLVGKYFSLSWVRKNVLKMTEDDIAVIGREIEVEKDDDEMLQFEPQSQQQEELEPENPMQVTDSTDKAMSNEETALVESMTRFYNSLSAEYEEDSHDESSG